MQVQIKLLSLVVDKIYFNWNKVKFYDGENNKLGMILKSLSLDLVLNVVIDTPLTDRFVDKIFVKLNNMTLIYEI
jgi:hypothetical protein